MAFIDFLLHFDKHLLEFVGAYGPWVYAILFAIIFVETGVVIWPFLPGDSLLFAAGALCAAGSLSTPITAALLVAAAFAGDAVNYSIGRYVGPRVFSAEDNTAISHRLLNRDHLRRAHEFFEKYGGKAVILGRLRADRPHLRAVCRRRGGDDAQDLRPLQHRRRDPVGVPLPRRGPGSSAISRSSRTTSRWSRSASSRCRCCRWRSSSSLTGARRTSGSRTLEP
jgi:membrane protein YqaA with SNARE-associated domain